MEVPSFPFLSFFFFFLLFKPHYCYFRQVLAFGKGFVLWATSSGVSPLSPPRARETGLLGFHLSHAAAWAPREQLFPAGPPSIRLFLPLVSVRGRGVSGESSVIAVGWRRRSLGEARSCICISLSAGLAPGDSLYLGLSAHFVGWASGWGKSQSHPTSSPNARMGRGCWTSAGEELGGSRMHAERCLLGSDPFRRSGRLPAGRLRGECRDGGTKPRSWAGWVGRWAGLASLGPPPVLPGPLPPGWGLVGLGWLIWPGSSSSS